MMYGAPPPPMQYGAPPPPQAAPGGPPDGPAVMYGAPPPPIQYGRPPPGARRQVRGKVAVRKQGSTSPLQELLWFARHLWQKAQETAVRVLRPLLDRSRAFLES